MAGAAKIEIVECQRAMTTGTSGHHHWLLSGRQHDGVADRITTGVQKIEINANAVGDEEIVVTRLTAAGVTDARAIADRSETVDTVLRGLVRTDAVVAAFDRSDVLKNDVATISVDIEAVVLEMRGRQIADDEMCVVPTQLDSRRPNGVSDVGLLERLSRLELYEERAASFV